MPLKKLSNEIASRLRRLPTSSIVLIPARFVGHGIEGSPGDLSNSYYTFEPIPYFEFLPDAEGDEHRIRIYTEQLRDLAPYNPELAPNADLIHRQG